MKKSARILAMVCLGISLLQCRTAKPARPLSSASGQLSERLSLIKMTDLKGKSFTLDQFGGRPVILNFWATWCKPCVSEMESLETIYQQYKEQAVFLALSNEPAEKIKTFRDSHNFHFEFAHLDVGYIDAYITSLPTTLLIDRRSQLVSEEEGVRIWTQYNNLEKIKNLLSK